MTRLLMQCCGSAWIQNFCLYPDPELKFRIRIQQKVKEHIRLLRFFFLIEFKGCFCIILDYTYLIITGWIRIRMDPELLPGSGSRTRKIQSWIRIRSKQFRIRNTVLMTRLLMTGLLMTGLLMSRSRNLSGAGAGAGNFKNGWLRQPCYSKSENQLLFLKEAACNEGIQQRSKIFCQTFPPPSPSFLTSCLVFAVASRVFAVEQF